MSGMPSLEESERHFKKNTGHELRRGQRNAAEYVRSKRKAGLPTVIEAPTGYGKSIMLLVMYIAAAEAYGVNRFLLVVPTTTQLKQYSQELVETAKKLGLDVGRAKIVTGDVSTVRYHRENKTSVFVTTVQFMSESNLGYFDDLMSTGVWALGADEHHHYDSDITKMWPKAIKHVSQHCAAVFAVSAAKVRTNGMPSFFGMPDVVISVEDALKEEAIRKFKVCEEHYDIDVLIAGEDGPRKLKTDDLLNNVADKDFSRFETRKQLRYLTKYVNDLIQRSLNRLEQKLLTHPGQHQMLVFCMSCKHAESVSKLLNAIRPGYADWAGTGPNGRSDAENEDVIKRYKNNDLPVFVQVDIAGEGFDNPRSSVALFLNLLGDSVKSMQHLGRVLRRNYGIKEFENDTADVFVSSDSPLVEFFQNFASIMLKDEDLTEGPIDPVTGGGGPTIFTIPDLVIVNAAHDRSAVRYPRGMSKEEAKEKVMLAISNVQKKGGAAATEEQVEALMEILRQEGEKEMRLSEDEEIEITKTQITKAVNLFIGNIIRVKYGDNSYDKTLFKDYVTRVNGFWKRKVGSHSDMTLDDLKAKFAWVQALNADLKKTKSVPPEIDV